MDSYITIAELNAEHGIYAVEDSSTGEMYVKKVLSLYSEEVYRHVLSHPIEGIPKIICLEKMGDSLVCIEEYIRGDSLRELLSHGETFSFSQIIQYSTQLCDILERLHSTAPPIIHRDIKPSNVMVSRDGSITLIDLNAAKIYRGDDSTDTILLGTEGYAAPEQYGFGESNTQTDIYAMGILLKELCGADNTALSRRKQNSLDSIIRNCTMVDRRQRYRDIASLRKDLLSAGKFRRFLPPGFRSGKVSHALFAILGYAVICFLSLSIIVDDSTALSQWIIRMGVLFAGLSFVFCLFNYCGIQRHFPLCGNDKAIVRIIGAIFSSFVISASIFFFSLILSFFF